MKITITINQTENKGNGSFGVAYRALKASDGANFVETDITSKDVVSFLDEVLRKYVEKSVSNQDEPADVTVKLSDGLTLTDGIKTFLSDKYTSDNKITSLTFA